MINSVVLAVPTTRNVILIYCYWQEKRVIRTHNGCPLQIREHYSLKTLMKTKARFVRVKCRQGLAA